MKKPLLALIAGSALSISAVAWAFAPELHNEDSKSYEYEIECGGSTTHSSISGNTTTTLSASKDCKLKVKGAGSAKLHDNMKCKIKGGMLDCD